MTDSPRLLAVSEVAHAANCQWRLWCYLTGNTELKSADVFHRYIGDLTGVEEEKLAARYRAAGKIFQRNLPMIVQPWVFPPQHRNKLFPFRSAF